MVSFPEGWKLPGSEKSYDISKLDAILDKSTPELLEKKLKEKFTCHEIISGLRDMEFINIKGEGYVPTYTRTDFTDALHEAFGFHTDYELDATNIMKKIIKETKK